MRLHRKEREEVRVAPTDPFHPRAAERHFEATEAAHLERRQRDRAGYDAARGIRSWEARALDIEAGRAAAADEHCAG